MSKTPQNGLFEDRQSCFSILAEELSGSATYPTVQPQRIGRYPAVKAVQFAVNTGQPVRMEGPAGFGKTSMTVQIAQALGYDVAYFHVPTCTADSMGVPLPVDDTDPDGTVRKRLEYVLRSTLARPGKKVVVLDEWNRAAPNTANLLMEMLTEGSVAGVDIDDLVTVIALQNPQGAEYATTIVDDAATASRFVSVQLTINDTTWREGLAKKYSNVDLTDLYKAWQSLPKTARHDLNPRVLDHLIYAVTHALPAEFALPAPNNERIVIRSDSGEDITDEALRSLSQAIPGGSYRTPQPADVELAYDLALRDGLNIKHINAPGTAKTAKAKARTAAVGLRSEYFSGPTMTPTDFGALLPSTLEDGTPVLESARWKRLTGDPFVLIIDEASRASKRVQAILMELYQERTIDGQPVPVHSIIALDNPRTVVLGTDGAGNPIVERLNVGQVDSAQAGRFDLTIIGMTESEHIYQWLVSQYGDVAAIFGAWHREDLDDLGRFYANFRVLEKLLLCHIEGVDMNWALPLAAGERVPVALADLHRRLSERPRQSIDAMTADTDLWVDFLNNRADHPDEYVGVIRVLSTTELSILKEKHADTVVQLLSVLDRDSRINLMVGASSDRQQFFVDCLAAAQSR